MGKNKYVGHRYVPKVDGEWDKTKAYESLTIVLYQGASYTSRQNVPVGVEITNEEFWVLSGNYNGQVENYRQEVVNVNAQLTQNESYMPEQLTDYVRMADNSKRTDLKSYVLVTGDRTFRVHMPIDDKKYQQWRMEKNANDDFIILSAGYLSTKTENSTDIGSKPHDSKEGSFNEASVSSAYTSQIGSKLYFRFKGVGLKFIHLAENRGGMWKFVVDGNESDAKFVSTYSTTSVTSKSSDVFDDLDNTFHNVVATFIGDDPNNPPSTGAGTARGWYHATATFRIIDSGLSFGDNQPIFAATSNKEFAVGIQPPGVTQRQWIPEHNGIGTLFATEQKMYIDDELVTSWVNNGLQEFKTLTLTQSLLAKHPDHPTNLIQVDTIHTFNGKNVFVKSKFKVLEPVNLNGYSMMSPIFPSNVQKVATANDTYNVGGTINEDFNTPNTPFSFLFLSTVHKNYVGATTISEPKKTFRIGDSGTRNPLIFLENRSNNIAKVYPQVLSSYDAEVGEVFEFSGYYTIGKMFDAERYFG